MNSRLFSKFLVILIVIPIGIRACQRAGEVLRPPVATGDPKQPAGNPELSAASRPATQPATSGSRPINHSILDELLKASVRDGRVDYAILKTREDELAAYLRSLAEIDPTVHNRDALLATYINAYNAATLKLIIEHYPGIRSIMDIPADQRWTDTRWKVAGETLSLDALEHQVLRQRFTEPRIHFAIVCASVSCPDLRPAAFTGERLDEQLQDQARKFHRDPRHLRWDPQTKTLHLSTIYDWFTEDFEHAGQDVVTFVARFAEPSVAEALQRNHAEITIRYLEYDWSLNSA